MPPRQGVVDKEVRTGRWGSISLLQPGASALCFCFYPFGRQGEFGIRFHLERKVESVPCFKKKETDVYLVEAPILTGVETELGERKWLPSLQ